jgi:hypothetical protein
MAIQQNRLKPRQQMDTVVQLVRLLAKTERYFLKQVVRLVFQAALFQTQFVYSVGIFLPNTTDPIAGLATKETRI